MNNSTQILDVIDNEIYVLNRPMHEDSRGQFSRLFCKDTYHNVLKGKGIKQVNYSITYSRATLRGMHLQKGPYAEIKIISCLSGKIWDCIVDGRPDSKNYLKTYSFELSAKCGTSLVIPMGFAHGFQSLEDNSSLVYQHSENYMPQSEAGFNCLDPKLDIRWPLTPINLSEKDQNISFL